MIQSEILKLSGGVGKRVRVKPGPEANEYWFRCTPFHRFPFQDRKFIDGTVVKVVLQHGDLLLYYVAFDEGFEGCFRADKYIVKFL